MTYSKHEIYIALFSSSSQLKIFSYLYDIISVPIFHPSFHFHPYTGAIFAQNRIICSLEERYHQEWSWLM